MTEQMTRNQQESAIRRAFIAADPKGAAVADMFVRWIAGGLVSGTGQFVVHSIAAARMHVRNYGDASFTCAITASLAPDFTRYAVGIYKWHMSGKRYHGEIEFASYKPA